MIGKSLRERYELGLLGADKAVAALGRLLPAHARPLVEVRAQGPRMIAFLVARADRPTLRLCRDLGFEMKPGATGVFGLLGDDAARLFPQLATHHRAWLEAPCGPRETKVFLVEGGFALLSVETHDGRVAIRVVPDEPAAPPA